MVVPVQALVSKRKRVVSLRVLLTGGGTGGHIYPALAMARELERRSRDHEMCYIGTEEGLEADIVPKAGIPFECVNVQGFRRQLSWDNVRTVKKFVQATRRSKRLIQSFAPDVVIGTGGYVCGPVVYAAHKLGIPTLIHEQNVIPGLTNKFLARYADVVAVSFEGSEQYFKRAACLVHTGNPRASEVAAASKVNGRTSLGIAKDDTKPIVLVVGGSRGARPINEAVVHMAPRILEQDAFYVVYVTGNVHYEDVSRQLGDVSSRQLIVKPYIYNMPEVLAASSLVVNRAGASTLAEITALGLPSILIPSPYVTNNHQEANARWLEKQGAARVILERELSADTLWREIREVMEHQSRREAMRQAAAKLGQPQAAGRIVEELDKLVNKRGVS